MKKLILFLLILFCWCYSDAQKYGVKLEPLCWTISGTDSSINRVVLISTRASQNKVLTYINAAGNTVDVSAGGTYKFGWCNCTNTGGLAFHEHINIIPGFAWLEPRKTKGK